MVVKGMLLARKIFGSIPGPVELDIVLSTACHRYDFFFGAVLHICYASEMGPATRCKFNSA